jgi:tetratricopeptide (TPR) repeat protein
MKQLICTACVLIALAAAARAQTAPEMPPSPAEVAAKELAERLKSNTDTTVTAALADVRVALESDPEFGYGFLRKYWLEALESSSRLKQADQLALDAILLTPWRTGDVEALQERRVRIALRNGDAALALSHARGLFNVTSLRGTERALILIVECQKLLHLDDSKLLRQLRREQLAGATTRPVQQAAATSPMILTIQIDPSSYSERIQQLTSDDEQTVEGKGNLLLLAGQAEDARNLYAKMAKGGGTKFHEAVARAIRASDGTIGRANGYILSMFAATPGSTATP